MEALSTRIPRRRPNRAPPSRRQTDLVRCGMWLRRAHPEDRALIRAGVACV